MAGDESKQGDDGSIGTSKKKKESSPTTATTTGVTTKSPPQEAVPLDLETFSIITPMDGTPGSDFPFKIGRVTYRATIPMLATPGQKFNITASQLKPSSIGEKKNSEDVF